MSQSDYELTLHPVDLSRHGLNPRGKPLYRVVWASSRQTKVMQGNKSKILQRYMHGDEADLAGHWVLERWQTAEKLVNMTAEQYEDFKATFPTWWHEAYPQDGDYEFTGHKFVGTVDEAFLHRLIEHHIQKMANTTAEERRVELEQKAEVVEQVKDAVFDEKYAEAREESLR